MFQFQTLWQASTSSLNVSSSTRRWSHSNWRPVSCRFRRPVQLLHDVYEISWPPTTNWAAYSRRHEVLSQMRRRDPKFWVRQNSNQTNACWENVRHVMLCASIRWIIFNIAHHVMNILGLGESVMLVAMACVETNETWAAQPYFQRVTRRRKSSRWGGVRPDNARRGWSMI